MMDVQTSLTKLHIIKNIALMNVAGKQPIKKLDKSTTHKRTACLVKKENVKTVDATIY